MGLLNSHNSWPQPTVWKATACCKVKVSCCRKTERIKQSLVEREGEIESETKIDCRECGHSWPYTVGWERPALEQHVWEGLAKQRDAELPWTHTPQPYHMHTLSMSILPQTKHQNHPCHCKTTVDSGQKNSDAKAHGLLSSKNFVHVPKGL